MGMENSIFSRMSLEEQIAKAYTGEDREPFEKMFDKYKDIKPVTSWWDSLTNSGRILIGLGSPLLFFAMVLLFSDPLSFVYYVLMPIGCICIGAVRLYAHFLPGSSMTYVQSRPAGSNLGNMMFTLGPGRSQPYFGLGKIFGSNVWLKLGK